jgi:hypothetical protein
VDGVGIQSGSGGPYHCGKPLPDIGLPNVDRPKIVPLATEAVEALADALPPRYRALIVLGAGTGVRISEALAVTSDGSTGCGVSSRLTAS